MGMPRSVSMMLTVCSAMSVFLTVGCSPKVYLIDRQTVLELEASGDWQNLDDQFHQKQLVTGPLPLEKSSDRVSEREIFGMTHSDADQPEGAVSGTPNHARAVPVKGKSR